MNERQATETGPEIDELRERITRAREIDPTAGGFARFSRSARTISKQTTKRGSTIWVRTCSTPRFVTVASPRKGAVD